MNSRDSLLDWNFLEFAIAHQLGMARDRGPRGQGPGDRLRAPQHMGQDDERRAEAVVGGLIDEAAEAREEAVQLRPRMMENPGRGPALRAAHDRGGAPGQATGPGRGCARRATRRLPNRSP